MPRRRRYEPQPFPVQVSPESLAAEAGIKSGDILVAVNDEPVGDFLDFYHQISEEFLDFTLLKPQTQEPYEAFVQRIYGEPLGLTPSPEPMKDIVECENRCVFCFIHQQPKGLRRSLFIRDDDYRYSFSHGNFITLTNLTPGDWKRIYRERLSPLNVSVHSMQPSVRREMIKHKRAGRIKAQLESLFAHDIQVHTQIVLCPGFNDGKDLDKTLEKLMAYYPQVLSVAIVPLGLTDYRAHLPDIPHVTVEKAHEIIEQVKPWQERCQQELGEAFIRLGDEFYWMTGLPFPPFEHYGSFEQMEDGIGGARRFLDTFEQHKNKLPKKLKKKTKITIMTGQIGADIIQPVIDQCNQSIQNLELDVVACKSTFWGQGITVSGLLMASDLLAQAGQIELGDEIWLPEVMVRNDDYRFLDDMTLAEFAHLVKREVKAVPETAEGLIQALKRLQRTQTQK